VFGPSLGRRCWESEGDRWRHHGRPVRSGGLDLLGPAVGPGVWPGHGVLERRVRNTSAARDRNEHDRDEGQGDAQNAERAHGVARDDAVDDGDSCRASRGDWSNHGPRASVQSSEQQHCARAAGNAGSESPGARSPAVGDPSRLSPPGPNRTATKNSARTEARWVRMTMAVADDLRRAEPAAKSDEPQPTAAASAKSANLNRSAPGGLIVVGRCGLVLFIVGDARSCRGPSDVHLTEVHSHPYRFGRWTMSLEKKLREKLREKVCEKVCEMCVSLSPNVPLGSFAASRVAT